ncbi:AlpA family phage regulatory protein [Devosia sp. YIM 151766]|uniref:helix-turn-helix transcriptional regulator n=1 Tax=Devosia sp. YIM 151766 TaxID=3017325 RepID=UPI00255CEAA3|nr:AlpA family phage regulatory protein [Devosia sp. YIM 151766]WIY52077.1 AlpA family phage regulatory protein [Devosia sp. YIM 151766]WIY53914.1 AlpA family phage regulatory protein [Devosia sp. YIM 151766]
MTDEIWRLRRVMAVIGMSRSWLYEEVAAGRFPAPLQLGQRAIGWRRSEVENWLGGRVRKEGNR